MICWHGGMSVTRPLPQLGWLLFLSVRLARASCACGFSVTNPNNATDSWLFTEMLETDFSTVQNMTGNPDWVRQEYNVSAEEGRGVYGKTFLASNAEPTIDAGVPGDMTRSGLDRVVLGLRVNGSLSNDSVPAAEIDSTRLNLHWGSYRTGMKVASSNGTCSAFFWYFNDTQEIDMEFLSQEFDHSNRIYPISLVIQSMESKEAGYDAAKTGMYRKVNLTFDPTADFHEYRFDYTAGRVVFFADSAEIAVVQDNAIPSVGGHLILQHWSNGNPLWSGGPPQNDAVLEISYVKAYFNTSDPLRLSNLIHKCHSDAPGEREMCTVPNIKSTDVRTGGHFFSKVHKKTGEGDGEDEGRTGEDDNVSDDARNDDTTIREQESENTGWATARPIRAVMVVVWVVSVSIWLLQI